MKNDKAFTLINYGKTSYLFIYFHRRFLPIDYKYRKKYFVGIVERDIALPILLREELYDMVS